MDFIKFVAKCVGWGDTGDTNGCAEVMNVLTAGKGKQNM
jgi:hypothetical protein